MIELCIINNSGKEQEMAIYAISDLHLSFGENKPMDIFGEAWVNHHQKIKEDWIKKVKEDDLVLLPGDFSWAMYLENTYEDFKYLNSLPGKKLLLKGNHDYWWTTLNKMRKYLAENKFENIDFIYNNSYEYNNKIIVGTRGWSKQEENSEKIIKRENERLKLSLNDGISKYGKEKEIIVCMHYPPNTGFEKENLNFILTMKKYNVKKCIYGHLHGEDSHKDAIQGNIKGIEFYLASADYVNFKLIEIV